MGGELVRTALYEEHQKAKANLVDFHGFELPIWYTSIKEEHLACRSSAGIFDVSHMGSFRFTGTNVRGWLESLATQKASSIQPGRCAYTHFLDDEGFLIDDMIFAVVSENEILGVPNASMIPIMWNWFNAHLPDDGSVDIEDLSDATSIIALQGPHAKEVLSKSLGEDCHVGRFKWQELPDNSLGVTGWIQGTGYTGEAGYEIFIPNSDAPKLWSSLASNGGVPVGLGARDTLRLEKGFLLSGVDFCWPGIPDSDEFLARDSWESNVPFGWGFDHDYIGKHRVTSHEDGEAKLHGIRYVGKGPLPRPGKMVTDMDGNEIGKLTSGAPSPSLGNVGIGMGYIAGVEPGDKVLIVASERKSVEAEIISPPFI